MGEPGRHDRLEQLTGDKRVNVQDSMTRLRRIAAGLAMLLALPAVAQEKMQLQLNWFQLADHAPV